MNRFKRTQPCKGVTIKKYMLFCQDKKLAGKAVRNCRFGASLIEFRNGQPPHTDEREPIDID